MRTCVLGKGYRGNGGVRHTEINGGGGVFLCVGGEISPGAQARARGGAKCWVGCRRSKVFLKGKDFRGLFFFF